ncbi:MAG: hypothetical protein Q6K70_01780 [Thermostichales cyanobacterium DRC_bins_46]
MLPLLLLLLCLAQPVWAAGEYITEPVPNATPEIRHVWRGSVDGIPVSLSNTSRGSVNVPLLVQSTSCGPAQLLLSSGRVVELGMMNGCVINVFPQLDKFINREVDRLRLSIAGQVRELSLTDTDKIGMAQVANQSREAFILFQQELVRVVSQLRSPTPAPVTPTPATPTPATPAPATPAPPTASSDQDFVIVGSIQEERSGAGSRLSVQAINRSTRTILAAQAKFDFFRNNQLVDTRIAAFTPSDVPPGATATAQVNKTDNNWDRVTVSFLWQR